MERIEPAPEEYDAEEVARRGVSDLFAAGAALFNDTRYEEAHEEFEKVWLSNEGGDADFFKGLIQAAICLHHFQRGNLDGARKLGGGHRRYLAAYLPSHRGLDVEGFMDAMQSFLAPLARARPGDPIPFDSARRPRIDFGGPIGA